MECTTVYCNNVPYIAIHINLVVRFVEYLIESQQDLLGKMILISKQSFIAKHSVVTTAFTDYQESRKVAVGATELLCL